jgi:quaternary ammonium compound-resistance protein SugE
MAWTALFFAGLFEIVWAVGMKYTDGFTRLWPTVGTFAAMAVSLALLGFAMKTLPLGTAYAVWTGIGTAGTVIIGMILFHEQATALRLGAIGLIVIGGIGLKILGS